jgi:hypothetical protein
MLEFMEESEGHVLGVRAHGTLTRGDYRQVLTPRLESMLQQFETVRVLFLMGEAFRGWNLGGALANTCVDIRHRAHFEKVAIVGAPRWEEWCVKLAGFLIAGEVRSFRIDQLQDAWKWLRA